MKNIFIVDSKPDYKHSYFDDCNLTIYTYNENNWETSKKDNKKIDFPHGTAIGGIIAKNIENVDEVNLIFFDIFSQDNEKMLYLLKNSLNYIKSNFEHGIINCSMGVLLYDNDLEAIVNCLTKNFCLVAAFDNAGAISYPAAFESVIGVDTSYRCVKKEDFVLVKNSCVDIRAKGGLQRVPWCSPSFTLNQGSSFACAYVSVYIANNYYNKSKTNILKEMEEKVEYTYDFMPEKNKFTPLDIKSAAIIPFNKEIHSILNFEKQLNFKVNGYFDFNFSGNIGKSKKSFYDENIEREIQSYKNIKYDEIDYLIIGHLEEISNFSNKNWKCFLLDECLENNVNVICFDSLYLDEYYEEFTKKSLKLISINSNYPIVPENFGKLRVFKTPIIGIFGTSSKQGKFTLQMQIKTAMNKIGYNVGMLGTEPTSYLFNFDYTLPFGYLGIEDSNITTQSNYLVGNLDSMDKDLLIVGSQSGTIPQALFNVGQIPFQQLNFLFGTQPDAVILCINIDDDISYIRKTINSIENLIDCFVVTLALFPFYYKNDWGIINEKKEHADKKMIEERKIYLQRELNKNVIEIGAIEDEDSIIKQIEDFFQ